MSQHSTDPNIASTETEGGGGARGLDHPGKTQAIWDSIGNKQLEPPPYKKLDPLLEKMLEPLWNLSVGPCDEIWAPMGIFW